MKHQAISAVFGDEIPVGSESDQAVVDEDPI